MSEYQLQIRQVVDYPRCRIYRQFVQSLITDQSIRTGGGSGLFYYTVLCSYANFRTSYRRIDGISYTVYPGEWICTVMSMRHGSFMQSGMTNRFMAWFMSPRKQERKCQRGMMVGSPYVIGMGGNFHFVAAIAGVVLVIGMYKIKGKR